MRIAYLCCERLDLMNAIPIHISEICSGLHNLGHTVELYTPYKYSFSFKTSFKVETGLLDHHSWFAIKENLHLYFKLRKKIKQYDIIYARFYRRFWLPAFLSKWWRKPLINEVNEVYRMEKKLEDQITTGISFFRKLFNFLVADFVSSQTERWIHRSAHYSIAVTEEIKKDLINHFKLKPQKTITLFNGVNPEKFRPLNKGETRVKLGLDTDTFYIGFIGQIEKYQGIDLLIKAANYFFKKTQQTKLLIIGSGTYLAQVKKLIYELSLEERIMVIPGIRIDDSPVWINAFDLGTLFKIPIDSGISPLKLYSMMACKVPIIASDIPPFRFLEEKNIGFVVPVSEGENTYKIIGEKLVELYHSKELLLKVSEKAREFVLANFTWEITVNKTEQIIHSIMKSTSSKVTDVI